MVLELKTVVSEWEELETVVPKWEELETVNPEWEGLETMVSKWEELRLWLLSAYSGLLYNGASLSFPKCLTLTK